MGRRGPKPQSQKQKRAKGERRPSQQTVTVIEFPKVSQVPEPADWLNADGQELWRKVGPMLFAQRLLSHADLYALGHLCQLHGKIVDGYRRQIQPTAAELSQLRMYFSEFGMTPTSRTRVGGSGGDKKNPFERNGPKTAPRGD